MGNITVNNLVLGPAHLYVGAFGSTEPADSAVTPSGTSTPPATPPWYDVGGTDGGVTFEADTTYTDLQVDQVIMPVGARLTGLAMQVTTKMSEMTLTNLQTALNSITTTSSGSGYETSDIVVGTAATQPTYAALIIDGWAPMLSTGQPALRRVIVRKVLSKAKVQFMFDKKTQQSLDVTLDAYYVSSSVNPVHVIDQQA